MELPSKCPLCGGDLSVKKEEKVLKGGNNTAIMAVEVAVCHRCGEHLYKPEDIELFEQIRGKLEANLVEGFELIGNTYKVA